jgi:hypothetical protein
MHERMGGFWSDWQSEHHAARSKQIKSARKPPTQRGAQQGGTVAFHLGIRPKQAREMITYHQKRAGEDRAPPDDGEKAAGRGRALLPASRRRAPAPARSTTTEGGAGSGGPVGAW